jgi:hypothetical protein
LYLQSDPMKSLLFLSPVLIIALYSCAPGTSVESTMRILDFINEMDQDLSFDDFGHVEVIGKYNTKCECLIVEQILPIRKLLVLEPSKD